ncbi:amino acid permease [Candidatus Kapabacteria bacterium]|nr:amino acid permease [Candidatus Kapabacteria bacterium]
MNNEQNELNRQLGFFTVLTIVVGAVIGSGIFKKPALMADSLGSPELMIVIWVAAGVLTLFGALTNAEIASMITSTGGQYVFFAKMYGRLIAFLYGWGLFAIIQTGSIASITWVFAEYSQFFDAFKMPEFFSAEQIASSKFHIPGIGNIYPLDNFGIKIITSSVILFLTFVNYFGVIFGGRVANIFTIAKVLAILILVGYGFAWGGGSVENFTMDTSNYGYAKVGMLAGILAALSGAFWSYDGWNNITYIAGEVKNPQVNIPKALGIGTLIIIAIYVLINLAFLYVLPVAEMSRSAIVAADVAEKSMGAMGAAFVSAAVMVSTFGTSNGTIMVSARVYYAMAKNKMFFTSIGKTHTKYKTPANALIWQGILSCLLTFSGTFDTLTDMLIFVSWIFYAAGAYGVFILRKKMPDTPRPYKVIGYPYVPAIFVLFASAFVIMTLYNDIVQYIADPENNIVNSAFGLLLVLIGLPIFFWYERKR